MRRDASIVAAAGLAAGGGVSGFAGGGGKEAMANLGGQWFGAGPAEAGYLTSSCHAFEAVAPMSVTR